MRQTQIRCMQIRGGTSKGVYFLAADLPTDSHLRDRVLLAALGSPDDRQIDGLGGGNTLTSKVAIVQPSTREDADVDYLFAQVLLNEARVDYGQPCGNLLAGVGPFALECGLVPITDDLTSVRIHMTNTGQIAIATVQTPEGEVRYDGDTRVDGVPGSHAPILIEFKDIAGSSCGALLPTGTARNVIDGVEVTCIDNGMPVVLMRATDVGCTGYESPAELEADEVLKGRVEAIRLQAGVMMNLGDVRERSVPKMCLVAPPRDGGAVSTRTFIPHRCHSSIGVFGAVSVATACLVEGSVLNGLAVLPEGDCKTLFVEHPTGALTVQMQLDKGVVVRSGLVRTARVLAYGQVCIPRSIWVGVQEQCQSVRTSAPS
ncbi:4-oxalomesaconate tautomerase [Pseudomonas sp. NA-150]|uniref:4-oxalomesaconate tautomerase n=1 Tax=Pseudomonas sp. NA-150 TaxID=3367525 RepID=UPI0037C869FA